MNPIIKILLLLLIPLNTFGQTKFVKFPKSQIKVENNKIILNNLKSIEFSENSNSLTKLILSNGLLDPYEINGSYNLKISTITEIKESIPNPKNKKFDFWIFYSGNENPLLNSVNPHEYSFELQNENATTNTSIENFIEGAKLTFIKYNGIIL